MFPGGYGILTMATLANQTRILFICQLSVSKQEMCLASVRSYVYDQGQKGNAQNETDMEIS